MREGRYSSSFLTYHSHFGGWAAPNIFYMGASNVVELRKGGKSIKIGGISGIYG